MSNFSFSHSVFYPFGELSTTFIKFENFICKLFQFGRVNNLSFGKGLKTTCCKRPLSFLPLSGLLIQLILYWQKWDQTKCHTKGLQNRHLSSLPNNKILDWTNWKRLQTTKQNKLKWCVCLWQGQKHCGKRRKCWLLVFKRLFTQGC